MPAIDGGLMPCALAPPIRHAATSSATSIDDFVADKKGAGELIVVVFVVVVVMTDWLGFVLCAIRCAAAATAATVDTDATGANDAALVVVVVSTRAKGGHNSDNFYSRARLVRLFQFAFSGSEQLSCLSLVEQTFISSLCHLRQRTNSLLARSLVECARNNAHQINRGTTITGSTLDVALGNRWTTTRTCPEADVDVFVVVVVVVVVQLEQRTKSRAKLLQSKQRIKSYL